MALQAAFYGAGPRAQRYLHELARRPKLAVVAVCDPDTRAAEQTAAGWGARIYPTWQAMLQEAQPGALWVCVPPRQQGEVLLQAAAQGIPCFIEPPGATDFAQARSIEQAFRAHGVVTAVGFNDRHADVVHEAREYLGANPVSLALGWWLRPARSDQDEGAPALLWNEGCQLVDALRSFCGDVKQVRALPARGGGLVLQLEFVGDSVGVLTLASFARPEPRIELELLGEGWSLGFGEEFSSLRLAERDKTTILRRLNDAAADHITAFLKAIETGRPSDVVTGCTDALHTLAVCHAALLSAREQRPVTIEEALTAPPVS